MAEVYLAREGDLDRLVAIKVLRPELASDSTAQSRFEREARAAARLSHPNVVDIYRVTRTDRGSAIVMEYVDGQNLADALKAGAVTDEMAAQILREMASALAEAHDKGVIHRDVRPANVVWDSKSGRSVLTDFGIAGVLEPGSDAATRLTRAGQVLGDPSFTSPEHLLGRPLTGAADIYALGVMGYYLLAGRGPYPGTSPAAIANDHLRASPEPLRALRPDADEEVEAILLACLARRPDERPRAADLVRRLDRPGRAAVAVPPGGVTGMTHFDQVAEGLPGLQAFILELRRRRVFNVAAVYAVAAFAVLQGGELMLPVLPLPEWSYPALVAVTLAFFPVALVLGWMFDLGASGITATEGGPSSLTGLKLRALQVAGLGFSLLLAGAIGWWVLG